MDKLEDLLQTLIIIHAALGTIALICGSIALIAKKGLRLHKRAGKVFVVAMGLSIVLSIIIAVAPGHTNIFLLSIGIFSLYFLVIGYRALRYKVQQTSTSIDIMVSRLMWLISLAMIIVPLIVDGNILIVSSVFGAFGIWIAQRNINVLKNSEKVYANWLQMHLGNITGAFIASVTAFLVVNDVLPSMLNWFLPGIIGGIYIAYWIKKTRKINRL